MITMVVSTTAPQLSFESVVRVATFHENNAEKDAQFAKGSEVPA